ncbi:MAG TPA: Flp family type IVb pilin [Microvirga sp.]|jgi:pilus assembly protein Flp/PilA
MTAIFKRFAQDESGATAIEYALIAALMATALIAAMEVLGDGITDGFTSVVAKMQVE